MQLTLHTPHDVLSVRAMDERGIHIGDHWLTESFLVLPDALHTGWPVTAVGDLDEPAAEALLAHRPELIVIGTGPRIEFPDRSFQFAALSRGIGIECMDNRAACRTYNVLVDEGRRVLMGVIL